MKSNKFRHFCYTVDKKDLNGVTSNNMYEPWKIESLEKLLPSLSLVAELGAVGDTAVKSMLYGNTKPLFKSGQQSNECDNLTPHLLNECDLKNIICDIKEKAVKDVKHFARTGNVTMQVQLESIASSVEQLIDNDKLLIEHPLGIVMKLKSLQDTIDWDKNALIIVGHYG